MNELKQFFSTKIGVATCGVLVLVIGIYIGSGSRAENPAPPVAEMSTSTTPSTATSSTPAITQTAQVQTAPTKKTTTPIQTKTVVAGAPVQTQIAPAPASPTCTLVISPSSIVTGGSAMLSWTTTNTASFSLDHGINWVSPVAAGSTSISPPSNTTYTGTATGPGGSIICTGGIVVTAPPAPPASWHTVATFSGQTQKNTSAFAIQGSQWRIIWQETGDGYFGADADSPDGSGSYCSIANLAGSGSDTTYCYKSGTYYISVNTAQSWTMTVEDYY